MASQEHCIVNYQILTYVHTHPCMGEVFVAHIRALERCLCTPIHAWERCLLHTHPCMGEAFVAHSSVHGRGVICIHPCMGGVCCTLIHAWERCLLHTHPCMGEVLCAHSSMHGRGVCCTLLRAWETCLLHTHPCMREVLCAHISVHGKGVCYTTKSKQLQQSSHFTDPLPLWCTAKRVWQHSSSAAVHAANPVVAVI